jgi:hypothetical protein
MKRITTLILMSLALVCLAVAGGKERVTVKVTARNDSNVAYSYAFVNDSYGLAQNINLSGATFTLLLPNGDKAVVNCTSKFHERFARAMCARAGYGWLTNLKPPSTGTRRSCLGRLV